MDKTLFIRAKGKDFLLPQIYVDDIIFGATKPWLVQGILWSHEKRIWDKHSRRN